MGTVRSSGLTGDQTDGIRVHVVQREDVDHGRVWRQQMGNVDIDDGTGHRLMGDVEDC